MDDNVDETESVKRYNQYKLDFRRQQLQDFFLQHKDQEWFRSKYHPEDMAVKRAESLAALKTRLRVFLFLLDNSWLDGVQLDSDHAPSIITLMDAGRRHGNPEPSCCRPSCVTLVPPAVIKMEGGTDFDLQVLQVPTALVVSGGAASRAADRSQDATLGGVAQARAQPPGSQAEEAGGHKGRDRKGSQQVCAGVGE